MWKRTFTYAYPHGMRAGDRFIAGVVIRTPSKTVCIIREPRWYDWAVLWFYRWLDRNV